MRKSIFFIISILACCCFFACSSDDDEEVVTPKDEYYVRYSVGSHGYNISIYYKNSKGETNWIREKNPVIAIGPVNYGFCAVVGARNSIYRSTAKIEVCKNGGPWLQKAQATSNGTAGFSTSYTIDF